MNFILKLFFFPIKIVVFFFLFLFLSICLILFLFQDDMMFPGRLSLPIVTAEEAQKEGAQQLIQNMTDGAKLLCHKVGRGTQTILAFPGNAQGSLNLALALNAALLPFSNGSDFNVIACSWRGYEGGQGTPSGEAIVADARALTQHFHPVSFYGRSLGAGIAALLAAENKANAVVVSPYDQFSYVARDKLNQIAFPSLVTELLFSNEINASVVVPAAPPSSTLSVLALKNDLTILPERSNSLAKAWGGKLRLRNVPGEHNSPVWQYLDGEDAHLLLPPLLPVPTR